MDTTQSPQEIAEKFKADVDAFLASNVTNSGWNALQERMTAWFKTLGESVRFEAAVMVMKSHVYQHQLLMGDVLKESGTPLLIGPSEFIKQLAPTINCSAGTIANYLREQVGQQSAVDACQVVLAESTDARTRQGIETFLYFVKAASLS